MIAVFLDFFSAFQRGRAKIAALGGPAPTVVLFKNLRRGAVVSQVLLRGWTRGVDHHTSTMRARQYDKASWGLPLKSKAGLKAYQKNHPMGGYSAEHNRRMARSLTQFPDVNKRIYGGGGGLAPDGFAPDHALHERRFSDRLGDPDDALIDIHQNAIDLRGAAAPFTGLHPPTHGKRLLNSAGGLGGRAAEQESGRVSGAESSSWPLDSAGIDTVGAAGIVAQRQKSTQPVQGPSQVEGEGGIMGGALLVAQSMVAGGGLLQNQYVGGLKHSTGAGVVGTNLG